MKAHRTSEGGIRIDLGRGFGMLLSPEQAAAVEQLVSRERDEMMAQNREEFYQDDRLR